MPGGGWECDGGVGWGGAAKTGEGEKISTSLSPSFHSYTHSLVVVEAVVVVFVAVIIYIIAAVATALKIWGGRRA